MLIFINGKSEVAFDNVSILSHSPPLDLIITTSDFGQWYDMGVAHFHQDGVWQWYDFAAVIPKKTTEQ